MSNIKQLKDRYFDKELRLYNLDSKNDLISKLIDALTKFLPEDINKVTIFRFNIDTNLPLLNTDFYIQYKGLETTEEYQQRLIQEQIDKNKKLILLNKLSTELGYKLEKVNE